MELFHEYYSSQCQFAFDLLAMAKRKPCFSDQELRDILAENHAPDLYLDIRKQFLDSGFLVKGETGKYTLGDAFPPVRVPLPTLERAYLKYLCDTPEAALFLEQETRDSIKVACGQAGGELFSQIQRPPTPPAPDIDPQTFRTLLEAIARHQMVRYSFRTFGQERLIPAAHIVPFRIEHSVLDGRWWAILYNPEEDRPIKARLERLSGMELDGFHAFTEKQLQEVILRQVEKEPVVLRISPQKNALERTFLTFENALDMSAQRLDDGSVRLRFSLFRFDRKDLVKKLLYLGESVVLEQPPQLRELLREKLEQCLAQDSV
ncbi:MAG TPA: hypothetical protein DF613_01485 [Lachnospiraceae bacterium]|nr:hypothetical protein [Lachnospiraceae bacterium]